MKQDQQRIQSMLLSTVSMLCRNGVQFDRELKVEGLIGITIDNDEVFLVHIDENMCSATQDTQIAMRITESRKRTSEDSVSKHSRPQPQHSVVEIKPLGSDVLTDVPEPGIVSETPASPQKRRKRRRSKSSENSTGSPAHLTVTEDDSNASNSIIIKAEPVDDDLEIVDADETRTTSSSELPGEIASSFAGFGDISSQSFDSHTDHKTDNRDSLVAQSSAFVTGLVKKDDTGQNSSWNTLGLVAGIPVVGATPAQEVLDTDWTLPSAGRKNVPAAVQGSTQSGEMVGTSLLYHNEMQTQLFPTQVQLAVLYSSSSCILREIFYTWKLLVINGHKRNRQFLMINV